MSPRRSLARTNLATALLVAAALLHALPGVAAGSDADLDQPFWAQPMRTGRELQESAAGRKAREAFRAAVGK